MCARAYIGFAAARIHKGHFLIYYCQRIWYIPYTHEICIMLVSTTRINV